MTRARNSIDYRCPTCRSDFDYSPPTRRHTAEKVLADIGVARELLLQQQGSQK